MRRNRDRDINPLVTELRAERDHPLVQYHFRATWRRRLLFTAVLAMAVLLLGLLTFPNPIVGRRQGLEGYAHLVACLWPLLMCMGAASSAASAVLAERFGSLMLVSLYMIGRFVVWGFGLAVCFIVAAIPLALGLGIFFFLYELVQQHSAGETAKVAALVVIVLPALITAFTLMVLSYRRLLLRGGVEAVMAEFGRFDRLADPDYRPEIRPATDLWSLWWDDSARL